MKHEGRDPDTVITYMQCQCGEMFKVYTPEGGLPLFDGNGRTIKQTKIVEVPMDHVQDLRPILRQSSPQISEKKHYKKHRDKLNYETKKFVIRNGKKFHRDSYEKLQKDTEIKSKNIWKRIRAVNQAAGYRMLRHIVSEPRLKELEIQYKIAEQPKFYEELIQEDIKPQT